MFYHSNLKTVEWGFFFPKKFENRGKPNQTNRKARLKLAVMALDSNSIPLQDQEEQQPQLQDHNATAHHPSAPPNEVQNLVLEVLLANLMVSQSVRATEISLGIIGNLACHEVPMKQIVSANGLIGIIVDQLFSDDAQCLCETCRLLTVGLHSSERITWAKALQSEHNLSRILWIAENSLNLQLIEKNVELLLATIENSDEVVHILLPPLMKLGVASLLISLLDFEMSKLMSEREPERYPILDVILRSIEALSVIDGHSQHICSNKKLFQLACDLVKLPDKVEVSNSCVTAAILIANILSDESTLALEIAEDLPFLQGLLDLFPFSSDDLEARSALWNIIARLMVRVKEKEMSPSVLQEYVLVLVNKSDAIEDDLLDFQLGDLQSKARTTALRRIVSILNQWTTSKDYAKDNDTSDEHADDLSVDRLLDCCRKHSEKRGILERFETCNQARWKAMPWSSMAFLVSSVASFSWTHSSFSAARL
ncbi:hypothetical protein D8674_006319 [Pyrus ussuriensis x Pyrus communis]|uniref:ARM repeat superfamily protein n=1 Tax=Pyrus ussuriensis x Pyrus communis TaxID=2448454 RepID=A0A5N5FZM3_9ROSA|nr:hypothetical protein D8674_006319 [Pyrus ussuriensis x Pyrus communis]